MKKVLDLRECCCLTSENTGLDPINETRSSAMTTNQDDTDNHILLNPGEDNEMDVFGYRTVWWRQVLCIVGYIFSLGVLLLVFYWKPEWDVWCHCVPCSLKKANVTLLRTTDDFKKYSKKNVWWVHPFTEGEKGKFSIMSDEKSLIKKSLIMPEHRIRCIRVQKIRYVWNTLEARFQKIGVLEEEYSCSDVHSKFGSGLTNEEQEIRKQVCGLNAIEVEIVPIWKLLFKEVLNPFYIFQAFALSLWLATGYIEFSVVLIIITVLSMAATVYNLRMQSVKLHNLVESHNSTMVTILRKNGVTEEVESRYLVPGDVIVLTGKKFYLPCDTILITGGCIVNEGMLTGESIPVTKTSLPNIENFVPWKIYSGEDYKRHVLFCGTEVIQTRPPNNGLVKAVVLRTGFNTAKGDLVRSILYPKPVNFKLHRDVLRFLMGLMAISVVGVIYTVIVYIQNAASAKDTVLWSLLVITVSVPAALPAAVTVCILYSQMRLQKNGIFCLSAQRINMCGQLNIVCFDKTGTLTEDGMELWGIVPSNGKCFQDVHIFTPGTSLPWGPLLGAMVSCHSLMILDGAVCGDPLDLKMFEGTDWKIQDNEEQDVSTQNVIVKPGPEAEPVPVEGVVLLHQFPFSSSLQRMSVVAQVIGEDTLLVFLKGAPEMVVQFCKQETVPSSFPTELEHYTLQGFRVIALAYKTLNNGTYLDTKSLEREEVESDLLFLGLLIMENKLKPETKSVLHELNAANIRTVMITGDNLQTACTVGKTSGMFPRSSKLILVDANAPEGDSPASIKWQTIEDNIENGSKPQDLNIDINGSSYHKPKDFHFAMSGKTYQVVVDHFPELLPKILLNGTIFARMSPGQKSNLIEEFQKIDYYAGMCGDGANDCGALKVAHAGISLSELEASVASPFTSKTPNIECVPKLIKEGRNCLVTSFCVFKYVAMYAMIELICLMLLFWEQTILGNRHYLMQDVAITITVSLTMSLTGPAPVLAPYRPAGQLISPPLLLSMVLNFIFSLIVQTIGFTLVQQQPWYNETDIFSACLPPNHTAFTNTEEKEPLANQNFLSTTMWFISGMNLIIVEFVFSKGKPFRQPLYANYVFSFMIAAQLAAYIFVYFADIESVYQAMELICTPYYWRGNVFIMVAVLFAVSYIVEEAFIENRNLWLTIKRIFNYKSKSQYKRLQRMLEKDTNWPPENRTDYLSHGTRGEYINGQMYENPAFDYLTEKTIYEPKENMFPV
ncbi:probable cation-transporting ATPase 13A4 [Spea bombifrons]|uniref:probable cation-transporting ATPase 13A4 n=1 Tax=Spea bombifrons TaxID=233779 RepID=UPI00234AFE83|nr:probable cation-transporting ATPase 13A4 [Spea bombifrons]